MKIQGGNNGNRPIDFAQAKTDMAAKPGTGAAPSPIESVDAKLSAALSFLTTAISESGLTAGQIHSQVDESRLENVLKSLDRVEAKRPQYDSERILQLSNRVAQAIEADSQGALAAFKTPNAARVADLLS